MIFITFKGKVISGQGKSKKYLALPWVQSQIKEKLGFSPFLGTLNLRLNAISVKRKKQISEKNSLEICPVEDYCTGMIFPARVKNFDCAIIVPKVKDYPDDMIEIIAYTNLREQLHLKDGETVIVEVSV